MEEKYAQPPREPQPYEDYQAKSIQEFGVNFKRNGLRLGSRHQEPPHILRLTWAKKKKNWTVSRWSKVLFSDESKFCISFGNQGPGVWRKGGETHSQVT